MIAVGANDFSALAGAVSTLGRRNNNETESVMIDISYFGGAWRRIIRTRLAELLAEIRLFATGFARTSIVGSV
jgi:hypothetical protein